MPMNISHFLIASPTLTHAMFGPPSFKKETLKDLAEGRWGPNLQRLGLRYMHSKHVGEFLEMGSSPECKFEAGRKGGRDAI